MRVHLTQDGARSLTLRAYACLNSVPYKQSTEQISEVCHASMQSTGHVLGMLCKRGFVTKETIIGKSWWNLPIDPVPASVILHEMNKTACKLEVFEIPDPPKKLCCTWCEMQERLPEPKHPMDIAWKAIHGILRDYSRLFAPPVPDPAGPDAGLTPDR